MSGECALSKMLPKLGKNLEGIAAFPRSLIEHGKATVDLGGLCLGKRHRVMVYAVAKFTDKVKALLGGEVTKVEDGHGLRSLFKAAYSKKRGGLGGFPQRGYGGWPPPT